MVIFTEFASNSASPDYHRTTSSCNINVTSRHAPYVFNLHFWRYSHRNFHGHTGVFVLCTVPVDKAFQETKHLIHVALPCCAFLFKQALSISIWKKSFIDWVIYSSILIPKLGTGTTPFLHPPTPPPLSSPPVGRENFEAHQSKVLQNRF